MGLFDLGDLENEGKEREKLIFEIKTPTKMKILETKEGTLEKSGFPYYVLCCRVLSGEHAGKDYELFINTKYKTKEGIKGTYGFKKVLQGLCKEFATKEIEEDRGDDLPETFKTQLKEVVGLEIELSFFAPDKGYQNIIYLKKLNKEETTVAEKTTIPTNKDNSF